MNMITFSNSYADDVADLSLPIQQVEFGISITREDQPALSDISGFISKARVSSGLKVKRLEQ